MKLYTVIIAMLLLTTIALAADANGCWDGSNGAKLRWTMDTASRSGTTQVDKCNYKNGTEGGTVTTGVAGKFGEAYSFNGTGTDPDASGGRLINTSPESITGHLNFSWCYWVKTTVHPTVLGVIWYASGNTVNNAFAGSHHNGTGDFYEYTRDITGQAVLVYDGAGDTGSWVQECYTYDMTTHNVSLWKDGVYQASGTNVAMTGNLYDANTRMTLGQGWTSSTSQYRYGFNGSIDELWYFNYTLNQTEITNLYTYNALSGAPSTPSNPTTVTLVSPTNNYHNNSNPTWIYTPMWNNTNIYQNCSLIANSTLVASNATALTNNTNNSITYALPGQGSYNWYISCAGNSSTTNSSAWTFYYDTTAPTITTNNPTSIGTYYYNDTILKNATYTDNIGLFNCSQEIYNSSGSLIDEDNGLCSGTSLTWANQTFKASFIGTGWAYNSATDTHTADKNVIIASIENKTIKFKNTKNNKNFKTLGISFADKESFIPSYIEQYDRIKFSYTVTAKNSKKDWEVNIPFTSDCPIYYIQNSPHYNHIVTCESWLDYDDVKIDGWAVQLIPINETNMIQKFTKSFPSAQKTVLIDPAAGGLNFGFDNETFTVLVDSSLTTDDSSFVVFGEAGNLTGNYSNISDGTPILGSCSYSITDTVGTILTGNMSYASGLYYKTYTPAAGGTYNYIVNCSATDWYSLSASGSFIAVTPFNASFSITNDPNFNEYTTKVCISSNTLEYTLTKTFAASGYVYSYNQTKEVYCQYGCNGNECIRSAIGELNIWWAIAATIFLLFLLFGRSSIARPISKFLRM